MNSKTWKSAPPAQPGLYVASACRNASSLRFWTGEHWTAPVAAADVLLPGRVPDASWPAAVTVDRRPIEWLEAVTVDAEGFVSWGGRIKGSPLKRRARAEVKLRDGSRRMIAANEIAGWSSSDVIAYRVPQVEGTGNVHWLRRFVVHGAMAA